MLARGLTKARVINKIGQINGVTQCSIHGRNRIPR